MSTNLERLREATNKFKDHRAFENYFIGALSVLVTEEQWNEALKSAEHCSTILEQ